MDRETAKTKQNNHIVILISLPSLPYEKRSGPSVPLLEVFCIRGCEKLSKIQNMYIKRSILYYALENTINLKIKVEIKIKRQLGRGFSCLFFEYNMTSNSPTRTESKEIPAHELSSAKSEGALEPVAFFDGAMPTGVTISHNGQIL